MKRFQTFSIMAITVLIVGIFFAGLLPLSLSATDLKPQYGGTLRIAEQVDGVSLGYPAKMARAAANRQVAPVLETLFRTDKAAQPVPWLAASSKNQVKDKTIIITLRKGIKFHDGTDFNAEAVKWNLDQCIAARTAGTEKFKSVDAVDNYTVRISLSEWDSTVTGNLASTLGLMVSPTACQKNGEQWCASHPVGTGPFEFVSWEKETRTVYKKFPGYWQKGKPYLDKIEWVPITDTLTRQLSLRKGELDIALWMAAKDLAGLEKDGFVVTRVRSGSGVVALIPDSINEKSPFADVRVRQAAQYAIDTNSIVKNLYYGEAEAANQWIYKGHWGYNQNVAGYPYNPAKAKQLLATAGYPNGFKTRIMWPTNPDNDQTYTAVQGYLKAVGIEAELDPVASGRYDEVAWRGGKWEGLIMNSTLGYPDVAAALAARYSGGGKFYSQMLIPDDYAKAIQGAIGAADLKTKQKFVHQAMKLMIDKYCLQLPLFAWSLTVVGKPSVHNHGLYGTPNTALWTPEDAWLEK